MSARAQGRLVRNAGSFAALSLAIVAAAHAAPFGTATPASAGGRVRAAVGTQDAIVLSQPETNEFLVLGSAFDRADGTCQPSDWRAEDLTTKLYAHITDRTLVNAEHAMWDRDGGAALPEAADQFALGFTTAIARTDSGGVRVLQYPVANRTADRWVVADPGTNVVRELEVNQSVPGVGFSSYRGKADLDPLTNGTIVTDGNQRFLYLISQDGRSRTTLAGGGSSFTDGPADEANLNTTTLAVAPNGDIYFADQVTLLTSLDTRLRILRRSDGQIITLATPPSVPQEGPFGFLLGQVRGIAVSPTGEVFINDEGYIRRLNVDLAQFETLSGPIATDGLEYSGGALYFSHTGFLDNEGFTGPRVLMKLDLSNNATSVVAGSEAYGGFTLGGPATATLGTQNPFPSFDQNAVGMDADGNGGLYFAAGGAAFHLHADGTIERIIGRTRALRMGTHAVRFGADSLSSPEVARDWVGGSGWGNNWSQRLTLPAFDALAHPAATLEFDVALFTAAEAPMIVPTGGGHAFAVQLQQADGTWVTLASRLGNGSTGRTTQSFQDSSVTQNAWQGSGLFHATVSLATQSQLLVLSPVTRLRIVVNTGSTSSAEDGFGPDTPAAAIVDNIRLHDQGATLVAADFETGTLQGCELSDRNALNSISTNETVFTHDDIALSAPRVVSGFDANLPSCLWTVTAPDGFVGPLMLARLESPWIAVPRRDTTVVFEFRGKLPSIDDWRFVTPWVRVKSAGDARPRAFGAGLLSLNNGQFGLDATAPVSQVRVEYPNGFQFPLVARSQPVSPAPTAHGFDPTSGLDSVQIVWQIEDRIDENSDPVPRAPSKLPIFDEMRVYQFNADHDFDGVADRGDICTDVSADGQPGSAAGQDADGDGCIDPTATLQHAESWNRDQYPIHYTFSAAGDPMNPSGQSLGVLRNAFAVWRNVTGADLPFVEDAPTPLKLASATDGVNLVTFEDPDFDFADGALAITPTFSFDRRVSFHDRIVLPGEIVDADIVFNPAYTFATASHPGAVDLASVAQHEIGHLLGISHSGGTDATMYFVLQPGIAAATLTPDDEAAVASAYPASSFETNFGTITGRVTRGSNGAGIPGALVRAFRLDANGAPISSAATDYTREDGRFALRRLSPGNYGVRVAALDGDVDGQPLEPAIINAHVAAIAETNFQDEWRSEPESASDDPASILAVPVAAGQVVVDADIVTNIDTVAPEILSSFPLAGSTDVRIDAAMLLKFSEPIDGAALGRAFKLRRVGSTPNLAGNGQNALTNAGRTFMLTPTQTLEFGADYELEVTTELTDREGVHLTQRFLAPFHTETRPLVAITDVEPRAATPGTFITIRGAGFQPGAIMTVAFERTSGGADSVDATQVTTSSAVVRIPGRPVSQLTGDVRMVLIDLPNNRIEPSNAFRLDLRDSSVPANVSLLTSTPLPFAPSDVALSADGTSAIAVGSDGLATVTFPPASSAVVTPRQILGGDRIVMSADGLRAFVLRPSVQDVVEVDANPASGTYGAIVRTLLPGGTPNAMALSPTGRLLYVAVPDTERIVVLDIDPASATLGEARAVLATPGTAVTGGLTLTTDGTTLAWTTAHGSVAAVLGAGGLSLSSAFEFTTTAAGQREVVNSESGDALLAALSDGRVQVLFHENNAGTVFHGVHQPQSHVPLGGDVSDLAVVPFRRALLSANRTLNVLQVVTLDSTSQATYLTRLADVPTNLGPTAVSVDGLGATAIVACATSRTLERYTLASGRPLRQLVSSMAVPGDMIAFASDPGTVLPTSRVELGGVTAPIVSSDPQTLGGAFIVPAGAPRGDVAVAVVAPGDTMRTFERPLRVFEPVTTTIVRSAGLQGRDDVFSGCVSTPGSAYLAAGMRSSPDGRTLAVLAYAAGRCRAMVDLYQITNEGPSKFASQTTRFMFSTNVVPHDFDFSADGRELYVTDSEGVFTAWDADPTSATFGTSIATQFSPPLVAPWGLAVDPLGRSLWIAGSNGPGDPLTALATSTPYAPTTTAAQFSALHALVPSRDGRWVIGGGDGQMALYTTVPPQVAGATPSHPGAGFAEQIVITGDGLRAIAVFANGSYAVMSLDPAAAGSELAFGTLPGGLPAFDVTTGPTPSSVIVSAGTGRSAFLLELGGATPVATDLGIAGGLGYVAMSPDHRSLWTMDETLEFSRLVLHQFSSASQIAVLAGSGQDALPGQAFPSPVRVRVVDGSGAPQSGVLVRFEVQDGRGRLDADAVPLLSVVEKLTDATGEASAVWHADSNAPGAQSVRVHVPVLGTAADALVTSNAVASDADTPPAVVGIGPADGATDVLANSELFVQFNQSMDLASLTPVLKLVVNGQAVEGSARSELGGRLVFWKPAQPLPFLAACTFSVDPGPLDTDGQELATGATTTFTAEARPALEISAVSPPAAAVGMPVTLAGNGFNPAPSANSVVLQGIIAPVLSASPNALVVRVPPAAVSGDLVVQTGGNASPAFPFSVLAPDTVLGAVIADLPSAGGVQSIAITPDGKRAYAANVRTNTLQALDLSRGATLTSIIVGVQPVMVAILPSGLRAYVVNKGSNDVSIVDVDPASPTYHTELKRIPVGQQPVAIAVSRDGGKVVVACKGDGKVFVIDAQPGSPSYDRVTKSAAVATGSQAIAISADGTRVYVGHPAGISMLDLRSGAVTKSATVASGSQAIAISADGAFLFALTGDGHLLVIDVTPGSTNENKVVKSATVASGSQAIAVSADGAKLFITDPNGRVLVYAISVSAAGAPVLLVPGASVTLTLQHEFTTGQGSAGIGVDPNDGFILVANSVAGTITQIGQATALTPVAMGFDFKPSTLNLRSHGRFVEAELFPPAPYKAKDIDVASIRIEGVVPVSRAGEAHSHDDDDDDAEGRARLKVKFDRLAIETLLQPGARVPIHVTGQIAGRRFEGSDTVRVIRGRVRSPHDHDQVSPGGTHLIAWESPEDDRVRFVNLVVTFDQGASWRTLAAHLPNTGQWAWAIPDTLADSVRVCVLLAEADEDAAGYAPGMVATSEPFQILRTTSAPRDIPGQLMLSRPSPNPARRGAVVLRFGLPVASDVTLELYDLMGRRVKSFVTGRQEAGWHDVRWHGQLNGGLARPGLYYVRLRQGGRELRQPLIWLE
ncbi:MAG: Ig-like domain-containing protein [Candidatus Eisenbacteria bacterium]